MEDSTCESFEPLKTLNLPHVLACVIEPKSFEPTHVIEIESSTSITFESPNYATKPMSSLVLVSATHNFPSFTQVYSRRKVVP